MAGVWARAAATLAWAALGIVAVLSGQHTFLGLLWYGVAVVGAVATVHEWRRVRSQRSDSP